MSYNSIDVPQDIFRRLTPMLAKLSRGVFVRVMCVSQSITRIGDDIKGLFQ